MAFLPGHEPWGYEMSLLPLFPVVLLLIVAVWFFWPVVVDPISRWLVRRGFVEADQLAENLFAAWSEQGQGQGGLANSGRG